MALKEIDTVLVKRKTGKDLFSNDIYSDEESVSARWNDEQKLVKNEEGLEFTSSATLYYLDVDLFTIGDQVKLSGTDDIFRTIKSIEKYRNGAGTKFFNIAYLSSNVR
jgi:hypothetical protein